MSRTLKVLSFPLLAIVVVAILLPAFARSRENARRAERSRAESQAVLAALSPSIGPPMDPVGSDPGMPPPDMAGAGKALGMEPGAAGEEPTGILPAISGAKADQPGMRAAFAADVPADVARKVIMNARLGLEVKEFQRACDEAGRIAREAGGYVASSQLSLPTAGAQSASLTVRVPLSRYGDVLAGVKRLGKVVSEGQSAEDVTERYVDLEARVRNLRAEDARVLALMNRATTLQQIVQIERRLTEVRGQLESLEGRLRYLKYQVAMATIEVFLNQPPKVEAIPETRWVWGTQVNNAFAGLRATVQALVTVATYLLVYAILWVPALALTLRAWKRPKG